MTAEKHAFTMRLDKTDYIKLRLISKKNHRSIVGELSSIIEQYIADYEMEHGQILLPEEEHQPKNTVIFNNQVGNNNFDLAAYDKKI